MEAWDSAANLPLRIEPVRAALIAAVLIAAAGLPGCVIVQTGVTNPIPGMTTVAVAPFINLSAERSVDGRRFALAYHAELQKIPGYQVIPVGVTEQAMVDMGLNLDSPDDVLRLAKSLGADAVVIGAVTDYTPYYPPRIGLQVSWYAPEPWRFSPGIPTDPRLGEAVRGWRFAAAEPALSGLVARSAERMPVIRAQSPETEVSRGVVQANGIAGRNPITLTGIDVEEAVSGPLLIAPPQGSTEPASTAMSLSDPPSLVLTPPAAAPVEQASSEELPTGHTVPVEIATAEQPVVEQPVPVPPATEEPIAKLPAAEEQAMGRQPALASLVCPPGASLSGETCPPFGGQFAGLPPGPYDPRKPIMAYTRLFDGSDAELTALLRDYVLLSGDLRSGGWEAYLHRTEDFLRFASHRMIVEMLTLHGGESKRRYVWTLHRRRPY